MPTAKPFVAVACVCEQVLIEKDEVVSLVRIVDTFYLAIPSTLPTEPMRVRLTAFISIKSGEVTGQHEISVALSQPDGVAQPPQRFPVVLQGGEHGVNIRLDLELFGKAAGSPPALGLYWLDVSWGEELLTRVPFKLQKAVRVSAAPLGTPTKL